MTDITAYLQKRRERVAAAWSLSDEIVLVGAGEPFGIPGGADQTYPFIAHSEYFWLTDMECVGGVTAFDPKSGWVDFTPAVTEDERVWEGKTASAGTPVAELPAWLEARRGRPIVNLGATLPGLGTVAGERLEELREALMHARRPKDEVELERMRRAADATARGFEVAREMIRPGVTERAIQVEMEAAFFRHGGDRTAYGTIVGAGTHSAVLHFSPTDRVVAEGDVVLIDAGAEVRRYASDITRTYRAGRPDGFFRELYEVVLGVEQRGVARCVPGAEWRDIHMAAGREIAEGLVALGILRGDPDSLVEQDAHALFFPHGLGHMVGLGVRDASGYLRGRKRSTRPGLSMLRTDLPLQPGYVITVEPGIYFIPALLNHPERRARYKDAVAWDRVEGLLGFGGIRIEDNAHVTTGEPEVLTRAVPRTLD